MQRHLQPAVDRFAGIEEDDEREKFRETLSGYVRTYAYLSQILPYTDHGTGDALQLRALPPAPPADRS